MDTIFFIGLISAVLYWIGGWLLLICIFVSLLLYLVGAFEMRPLKTFFQDILELKSHSLKQPLIFAAIIYFPIFIVSASIQEISDYRHNKKSHCINSKFQRDLCDRQVDKYVTALLVPEKSERISKLDRLNFFIPKAGSQEGHFFYEVFLRKVQFRDNYNNPKDALNNPEIKKILDELEMHPSVRMLHASTDFANGDLTLEESIAVWERELSRIGKWTTKLGYDFSRLDYSNRRLDFYLFKKDLAKLGPADVTNHLDLNSPAEFNDGVFSWLSPYGLVGLADLLLELGDQTESQVTYLAYLAYAKALTEDGGQQAAARQRMDVIKKRQDYQAVVAQIGKHQLPDGIASSQLLFSGNDCWSAYQQEKKKWALACAVSKKHPAALKLNAEISKDALRRAEIQAEVEARRRANEERLRQNEERSRLEWEALPSEKKAEEVGRKIGQGLGKAVDSITESEAGKSIKGFWKGLTE